MACDKKRGYKRGVIFGFFDESGFSDRPHVVRTWGICGTTPIIKSAGGWKRITAASMITFNTKTKRTSSPVWIFRKGMRKEKMLSILKDVKKRYGRYLFVLLWDGLPAHKAKIVTKFVESNRAWLTAVRFPSYAPELNPQEYVWSGVKRADLGNFSPPTLASLHGKVRRTLRKRSKEAPFLKGCLKASGLFTARELGEG